MSSPPFRHLAVPLLLAGMLLTLGLGCSEDAGGTIVDFNDTMDLSVPPDAQLQDMAGEDMAAGDMLKLDPDLGPPQPRGSRVEIPELEAYARVETPEAFPARVFVGQTPQDFVPGAVAHGKPGDYVMENAHVRVVIETPVRAMSPCPYGGNIIDGAVNLGTPQAPVWSDDMINEVCLLMNIGQTLRPQTFEVIQEGSQDQAAILAVTGEPETLDFLNFKGFVTDFLGPSFSLPFDPDFSPPLKVTQYHILRPGDRRVQVVTAFRNDTEDPDQQLHFVTGHLITGGGSGGYHNPLGQNKGFGADAFNASSISGSPYSTITYIGQKGSYAYQSTPSAQLKETLPAGGISVTVSGATATLHGQDALIPLIVSRNIRANPGAQHLLPGQRSHIWHSIYLGDDSLQSVVDQSWRDLGIETATLSGVVRDQDGQPVAGARVTALDKENLFSANQDITDAQGRYTMALPAQKPHLLKVYKQGQAQSPPTPLEITPGEAGGTLREDGLRLDAAGTLSLSVQTPNGQPTPARLTLICPQGPCPNRPTTQEVDIVSDPLPPNIQAIVPVSVDGQVSVPLAPGEYGVVVSRGMEWSLWPEDAASSKGTRITITPNATVELTAEIAQVMDSPGVLSSDFHIHAVSSTDSAVANQSRVLDFLTEGVDIMVSTDHDFISDFGPAIETLGVGAQITSVVGSEITTSDAGHINAFPLKIDPTDHRNGALDWGNGPGLSLLPVDIYAWAQAFEGEQVIQVNHPEGLGTISGLDVDTLRGISTADPALRRLPADRGNPATGDTGLWSEEFTAIEMFNGHDQDKFWGILRWWLTMVGRGFAPTATAVTDTHKLYGNLGAAPRSFVHVGAGTDTIATFDKETFAQAINAGRVVGSNGPFFTVTATNKDGAVAQIGDLLPTEGGLVRVEVKLQMPLWVQVDTVELFLDRQDVVTPIDEFNSDPVPADMSQAVELDPARDVVTVSAGLLPHKRWEKTLEFEVDRPDTDTYIVVVVRQKTMTTRSMWPVILKNDASPLAFSNPIFLDGDGNGWDNPPLKALSMTRGLLRPKISDPSLTIPAPYLQDPAAHGRFLEDLARIDTEGSFASSLYPLQVTYQEEMLRRVGAMIHAAQCSK